MSTEDDLRSFIAGIANFSEYGHADKVRLFAWLQHHLFKRERFQTRDISWCYGTLSYDPSNTSQILKSMEGKQLLRDASGYRCEGRFKAEYDTKYGEHQITLNVRQMVKDLDNVIPDLGEKDIFREAMTCLKYDAGRATILMVWNIAFYHLCQFILTHHLTQFNNRIPIRYPKKWKAIDMPLITKYDDFGDEMSEREVIEVANSAGIITGDIYKIYDGKLGTRNSVAHPSSLRITQVQAEGYIDDLIRNTVLLLKV